VKEGNSERDIKSIKDMELDVLKNECAFDPTKLIQFTLDLRHMLQLVFDIRKLAKENNLDPD
jgi:hypothetical protein